MTDLSDLTLLQILPDSIRGDEQVQAMAEALQPDIDALNALIPTIELYSRIDELPEPILRMLAWEHRVYKNEWALAQTIEAKRDLVRNSFELNQRRGTRQSLERVLSLLDVDASVQEWFEYGGEPYRFKVNVLSIGGQSLTAEQFAQVNAIVEQYKPLRAALETIDSTLESDDVYGYFGAANTISGVYDLFAFEERSATVNAYFGAARTLAIKLEVRPA
jgi:phage tail P2-like protein